MQICLTRWGGPITLTPTARCLTQQEQGATHRQRVGYPQQTRKDRLFFYARTRSTSWTYRAVMVARMRWRTVPFAPISLGRVGQVHPPAHSALSTASSSLVTDFNTPIFTLRAGLVNS